MSLEQTTELYASVLRQLLPEGVYDTAEMTHVADDIYAHAKALAQADIDAHRLLQVLETIPVDLLADYEREYGLPMQCMVPGSQTIEERISVLRWIRQHRNVMNREYLEQILAIFGVTLVDVVKHRPMLCTASCTSPVNTERLRYKVLLRLQYPMTADMSCIIENYLPGYLRVEWSVDMPWSEWIISPTVTVNTTGIAHYTAYKTNQREYYDSYANLDLTDAIIRSFHDTDMQQWEGFKDAVNELTGVVDWVVDESLELITYKDPNDIRALEYVWYYATAVNNQPTAASACIALYKLIGLNYYGFELRNGNPDAATCFAKTRQNPDGYYAASEVYRKSNPNYDPTIQSSITFLSVAQKIISNLQSLNEGTSLLVEVYIEAVANSIFNTESSKQFVKASDLIFQLELNKTLRT